jgi:16S rRNA (adenine1518-N6/adenine1519-N6)-dimethyltransferase
VTLPGPAGADPGTGPAGAGSGDRDAPDGDGPDAGAAAPDAAPDGDAHLLGPAEIRGLAGTLDLHPTKTLGQNFVIDPNTVRRIVRVSGVGPADVVLEVGPGLGSLTLALLDQVRAVVAVEVDPVLAGQLPVTVAGRAPASSPSLTVVAADALRITDLPVAPTALVANLPYNISVPVLLHLLAAFPTIERALVMVQREVAQRLAADPGSRVYGVPSVKARWFGDVRQAGHVGRAVFWPVPNVDSGLVEVIRTAPPRVDVERADVFAAVDAAFSQRRKMLRSALAGWAGGADRARAVLESAGVDPTARGEALDVAQFAALAAARRELAADSGS